MITSPQEYDRLLYQIQDENRPRTIPLLPSDEHIYQVDLNSRIIEAPEFLSVEHEHYAETIYFEVDRWFDNVDLAFMTAVVQYINGNGDSFLYPVPYYDIETKPGKILLPWCISGAATAFPGTVKFAIRFYEIDLDSIERIYTGQGNQYVLSNEGEAVFKYSLSTLPAESKVLYGMNEEQLSEEYDIASDVVFEIFQRLNEVSRQATLYWVDV